MNIVMFCAPINRFAQTILMEISKKKKKTEKDWIEINRCRLKLQYFKE